jgi:hypothetical protein
MGLQLHRATSGFSSYAGLRLLCIDEPLAMFALPTTSFPFSTGRSKTSTTAVQRALKRLHFTFGVILTCVRGKWPVRWVCTILLRQLEEMMAERGVAVDHSAVHRWALKLLPVRRVVLIAAEQGLLGYTGTVRHCLRCRCAG